jgi:hypothetical protein
MSELLAGFGKKMLNNAYPFYRALLFVDTGKMKICLPLLKLSGVNMQIDDIYAISSLSELDVESNERLNYLDYQLIDSEAEFKNQFQLLKIYVQERLSEDEIVKFKIIERFYVLNNQNINAKFI